MIKHVDFDDNRTMIEEFVMPDTVNAVGVTHDGGRLAITINGVQVFRATLGTRDCAIDITRDPQ